MSEVRRAVVAFRGACAEVWADFWGLVVLPVYFRLLGMEEHEDGRAFVKYLSLRQLLAHNLGFHFLAPWRRRLACNACREDACLAEKLKK
ncbi:MAG: hypothetical protein ABIJ09_17575 [Pseudomonadota bacterium]